MNIEGMVHVNINCSDYAASKKFYEMLGFEEVWRVPETNTAEVAAAVGMPPLFSQRRPARPERFRAGTGD